MQNDRWKYALEVVNCKTTMHEIDDNTYMCPDTGGAYSHQRMKYFGPYINKSVNRIFEIDAIVVIERNLGKGFVKCKNKSILDNSALIQLAKDKISRWDYRIDENKERALQVFLLSGEADTNFGKRSKGGMYGAKKYFWDIAENVSNSHELAKKLNGKAWSDF